MGSEPPPREDPLMEGDEDEEDEDEALFLEEGEALRETVLDADAAPPPEEDDEEGAGANGDGGGAGAGGSGEASGAAAAPERDDAAWTAHVPDSVYAVAFHPSADAIVAGGGDEVGRAWAPDAGTAPVRELGGHTDSITAVGFSADGALLATAGCDARALVWDSATGEQKSALEGPAEGIEWLEWHPRGHVILAGAEDFTAWMWNADTGACMQVFTGHSGSVTCGGFTPDGRTVVTASADGSLRVWDPRTGACGASVQGHGFHEGPVNCLAFSPDGATTVTGDENGLVCVTSVGGGRPLQQMRAHTDAVVATGVCPAMPSICASAGSDGKVVVWDMPSGTARASIDVGAPCSAMTFLPGAQGALFAVATTAGELVVYDSRNATEMKRLIGHAEPIFDVKARANADGSVTLLTGSDDKTVKLFKL